MYFEWAPWAISKLVYVRGTGQAFADRVQRTRQRSYVLDYAGCSGPAAPLAPTSPLIMLVRQPLPCRCRERSLAPPRALPVVQAGVEHRERGGNAPTPAAAAARWRLAWHRRLPLLLRQVETVRTLLIASLTGNFLRLPVFRGDR